MTQTVAVTDYRGFRMHTYTKAWNGGFVADLEVRLADSGALYRGWYPAPAAPPRAHPGAGTPARAHPGAGAMPASAAASASASTPPAANLPDPEAAALSEAAEAAALAFGRAFIDAHLDAGANPGAHPGTPAPRA